MKGLIPLVDSDYLMYRIGFAINDTEPVEFALATVKRSVNNIWDAFERKGHLFLTGKGNYRELIASIQEYKGNRIAEKPFYYQDIKDYLIRVHEAELIEGMEADDAVGIRQWSKPDKSTCIVGQDKDLICIPGHHYDPVTERYFYVTLAEANRWYWEQVLTGDRTDNILGCAVIDHTTYKSGAKKGMPRSVRKGVGTLEAAAILDATDGSWQAMQDAVRKAYDRVRPQDAYNSFRENATLVWIQRNEGLNFDGTPIADMIPDLSEMYGSQETNKE